MPLCICSSQCLHLGGSSLCSPTWLTNAWSHFRVSFPVMLSLMSPSRTQFFLPESLHQKRFHAIKKTFVCKFLFSADLWAWGARLGEMQCSKECIVGARPARVQIPKAARKLNLSVPQLPLLQNGVNKSIYLSGALWALNELIQAKCFEQCLAHSNFYVSICYRKICFYLHIPVTYTVSISKNDFQMNEWMNECLGGCLYWLPPWPGKSYRTFKTLRMEKYLQKTSPAPHYF